VRREVAELAERMDFAERLLAKNREVSGSDRLMNGDERSDGSPDPHHRGRGSSDRDRVHSEQDLLAKLKRRARQVARQGTRTSPRRSTSCGAKWRNSRSG